MGLGSVLYGVETEGKQLRIRDSSQTRICSAELLPNGVGCLTEKSVPKPVNPIAPEPLNPKP